MIPEMLVKAFWTGPTGRRYLLKSNTNTYSSREMTCFSSARQTSGLFIPVLHVSPMQLNGCEWSVVKLHWAAGIYINRELVIAWCAEPKSCPFVCKVFSTILRRLKLSQEFLLQALLPLFPKCHVWSRPNTWCAWLIAFLEATHQPQEFLLLVGTVKLGGAPLPQSLAKGKSEND